MPGKIIARTREREAAVIKRRIKILRHPEIGSPEWNAKIEAEIRHARAHLEIRMKLQKPTIWQRIFGKSTKERYPYTTLGNNPV